jgi:hypothetical protein
MRKSIALAAALLAVITAATAVYARPSKRFDERTQMCRMIAQGKLDWESEAWGLGGKKFQEVCKSCHSRNNDKGAEFLHAESYTSEGWNSVFAKRRVQCARDGSWDSLSEEEIQVINDYLYRNAAWSYDPNSSDSC